jgi:hypothetical protein
MIRFKEVLLTLKVKKKISFESHLDISFAASQALGEKQIQQSYRPLIGIHKWSVRRPGTLFKDLLLAEFNGKHNLESSFFCSHNFPTKILLQPKILGTA